MTDSTYFQRVAAVSEGARRLGLLQPLLDVTAERINAHRLASGAIGLVVPGDPPRPLGFSQEDPVGRPIAGPGEALAVHQGFQQEFSF